jgi:hypothetical protein
MKWHETETWDAGKLVENMVARDGIAPHYTGLRLPLTGLHLDPRLDIAA